MYTKLSLLLDGRAANKIIFNINVELNGEKSSRKKLLIITKQIIAINLKIQCSLIGRASGASWVSRVLCWRKACPGRLWEQHCLWKLQDKWGLWGGQLQERWRVWISSWMCGQDRIRPIQRLLCGEQRILYCSNVQRAQL